MATIKELAREAGVSPSTVSIVLGGKSQERKIPPATQQKVLTAARRLGYRPNVTAQRLRSQTESTLVFTVFWASDFRAPMMVRFLRGLQEAILASGLKCEIVIHPYENGMLCDSLQAPGLCNAAIICNAAASDLDYLDSHDFNVPIVLYNRHSAKYCTVNVDDQRMGSLPAEIFAARGHRHAAILTSEPVFPGMDVRAASFISTAEKADLTTQTLVQDNSMRGGYAGGLALSRLLPVPDCVFCLSDYLAVGALRAFQEVGLRIPENLELISIGNGDRELEEFARISLSVVHLPMEKMAAACYQLALDLLDGRAEPLQTVELPIIYRVRESCGDAPLSDGQDDS